MTEALIPFLTALILPKGTVSSPHPSTICSPFPPKTPLFFFFLPPRYFLSLHLLLLQAWQFCSTHHTDPAQITALSTVSARTA